MRGLGIATDAKRKRTKYTASKLSNIQKIVQNSRNNVDIVCLQELHAATGPLYNFFPFTKMFNVRGFSGSNQMADGVITFIKKGIICEDNIALVPGRLSYLRLKHIDFPNYVNLYNVYNHPSGRENEAIDVLNTLSRHLTTVIDNIGDDIYILGDFNINFFPNSPPPPRQLRTHAVLLELMQRHGLRDLNADLENTADTWRGRGERGYMSSRLDFILTNVQTQYYNKSILVNNPSSDHSVLLTFHEKQWNKQKEYYYQHFILVSDEFRARASAAIVDIVVQNLRFPPAAAQPAAADIDDPALLGDLEYGAASLLPSFFESMKTIHDLIFESRKKSQSMLEREYQRNYNKICMRVDRNPHNPVYREELKKLMDDRAEEIVKSKKRARELRMKIIAKEGGSSSPSSFLPFKTKRNSKEIRELHVDGVVYSDPQDILTQITLFHSGKVGGIHFDPNDPLPPPLVRD